MEKNKKYIKQAADYVFKNLTQIEGERFIKLMRACDTYGMYPYGKHCGVEKCEPCNKSMKEFCKLFKEELQRQIDSYGK